MTTQYLTKTKWMGAIADVLWFTSQDIESTSNRLTISLWEQAGFDLERDVLPMLRAEAERYVRRRNRPPTLLRHYTKAIRNSRDHRLGKRRRSGAP